MRLSDLLDRYAWSQIQLAREADVSVSVVAKVLKSEPITRRNAEKILAALNRKHKTMGGKDSILLTDIQEIHLSSLHRPRRK